MNTTSKVMIFLFARHRSVRAPIWKTTLLTSALRGLVVGAVALLGATGVRAVDFHCVTAQDLQNALTMAAANGANDNIYLTNGYYSGNFNFNSYGTNNLTVLPELGLTNTGITIDGIGGGRALNISSSGNGNNVFTVQGITFIRNCGSSTIGALRIGAGPGATIVVSGCQFLSPTNTSGMGLEIASGLNANVLNCTATGSTSGGGGGGISIAGVSGNVTVQSCVISTNNNTTTFAQACGLYVGSATLTTLTGNSFIGNLVTGVDNNGGAGACISGNAIFTGNSFIGNLLTGPNDISGGGAYCGGAATLIGNTFIGNYANNNNNPSGYGGGVYCNGNATLTGNTFIGNSGSGSGTGGGVNCNGIAALTNNIFTQNSSSSGGGSYCAGKATLIGNTFGNNSATAKGGGAYFASGTPTVSGNTFNHNSATVSGGGIYALGTTITISDNLVEYNTAGASGSGAGIWVNASSNLFLINNTITANNSAGTGGGVAFQVSGVVELLNVFNNIIWGNTASGSGGDVYLTGTGQKKLFEFNDADSLSGVWDIALNNIDLSPQFFDPVNGDYHLQTNSPCANAGTNGAPSQPLTDLDGNLRTNSLGQVDLGCYEFNNTATHPADTNGVFTITTSEYTNYAAAWKAGLTWTNGPNPGPNPISANYVTRAGYLMTNGGAYHNDGSARPVNWKIGH